jgi:mono/diheme cytochrome c family protein
MPHPQKPILAASVAASLLLTTACARAAGERLSGQPDLVERGRYLVAVMDCAGCHNAGAFSPAPEQGFLQGGTVGFEVPGAGVFYPPNLTPHPDAGLGRWSSAEIVKALRTGVRPDGRILAVAMPWHAYAHLSDDDARAVASYLRSLPPSDRRVPGPAALEAAPAPYLSVKTPSPG